MQPDTAEQETGRRRLGLIHHHQATRHCCTGDRKETALPDSSPSCNQALPCCPIHHYRETRPCCAELIITSMSSAGLIITITIPDLLCMGQLCRIDHYHHDTRQCSAWDSSAGLITIIMKPGIVVHGRGRAQLWLIFHQHHNHHHAIKHCKEQERQDIDTVTTCVGIFAFYVLK